MAFTGIKTYFGKLSSDLSIIISEKEVTIEKTYNRFISFSIKEWYIFSSLVTDLDEKSKCFSLLFNDKSKKNAIHTYERIISDSLSTGVTMSNNKVEIFIKYHDKNQYHDDSFSLFLNNDEFDALKWHKLDIDDFIEALPAAHQENQAHKKDEETIGCQLCFHVFSKGAY